MKQFIVFILLGFLLFAGCAQQETVKEEETPAPAPAPVQIPPPVMEEKPEEVIEEPLPPEPMGEVKEFKLLVSHGGYNHARITVNKGEVVRILATTQKSQEWHKHGLTIDEYGINVAVQSSDLSNPVKIEFTADKVGTFKIYCKTCNDDDGWKGKQGSTHPNIQATLEVK